jgi:hypothetical protein
MRVSSHSTARQQAPAMTAASGWAPPMPPRPAGQDPLALEIAAIVLASRPRRRSRRCPERCPACRYRSTSPRSSGRTWQALAIELVEMVPVGPVRHQVGVGDQHARRVGGSGTRRPACRTGRASVSSSLSFFSCRQSCRSPSRCARPGQCRHRPPAHAGFRPRPGWRLFISIRIGASVSQLLGGDLGAGRRIDVALVMSRIGHDWPPNDAARSATEFRIVLR